MKIGDVIHLGDNIPWRIRKPFIDWRGHVATADYNGYAKVTSIQEDVIEVCGLYGRDITGNGWIAHPVAYKIVDGVWLCQEDVSMP